MPAAMLLSALPLVGQKSEGRIVYDKLWLADSIPANKS